MHGKHHNVNVSLARRLIVTAVAGVCCQGAWGFDGTPSPSVRHPNLFLNPSEIADIRVKIEKHPWARDLYARLRAQADRTISGDPKLRDQDSLYYDGPGYLDLTNVWTTGRRVRDVGLAYAISGEPLYGTKVRDCLMHYAEAFRGKPVPLDSFTNGMGGIGLCWAYDLAYECFSPSERLAVEDMFRRWAHASLAALKPRSNNIAMWGRAFCGVVGYTIGDRELVAGAIDAPGGVKESLEGMVDDNALWREATSYQMVYVSSAMAALAEAALHADGVDLYRWRSPRGASMKGFYDAWLRLCFPCDFRVTSYGDYSSQSAFVSAREQNTGHQVGDSFVINDTDGRDWNKYDIAYHRYRDPAYAFVLSQNPRRDEWDHALWGYAALTHGDPLPDEIKTPDAPSTVYPESGVAMLRAEPSSVYWRSPSPAVSIHFGRKIGHGHLDSFHVSLHGKGALLEPDWFIQWDYGGHREGRNPTIWSISAVAHNTVMVDKKSCVLPKAAFPVVTQDFGGAVKVLRVGGASLRGLVQERTLALTDQYLLDLFDHRSEKPHVYDWLLHAFGRLDLPGLQFLPYDLGADLGFTVIDTTCPDDPANRWIRDGAESQAEGTWSAVWTQSDGRGVKVTMLPSPTEETTVYRGNGPYYVSAVGFKDTFPGRDDMSLPMVVVRRRAGNTTFIALHEPFDNAAPPRLAIRSIGADEEGAAVRIEGEGFVDYFFWTVDPQKVGRCSSEEIAGQFAAGYGYVRVTSEGVRAQGQFQTLRVRPQTSSKDRMTLNDREVECRRQGPWLELVTPATKHD
jgi:hypothetical protein